MIAVDKELDNVGYSMLQYDPVKDSAKVNKSDKEMITFVLNVDGYEWPGNEYRRISRRYPRTVQVTSNSEEKLKKTVHEMQVVFWIEKYAKRTKVERETAMAKAQDNCLFHT